MATFGTFVDGNSLSASELNSFLGKTNFTPVVTQTVSLDRLAVSYARYFQVNKLVFFQMYFGANSTGTANSRIEFDLPVTASSGSARVIGSGTIFDNSASDLIRVTAVRVSTTKGAFFTDSSTSLTTYLGQTGGPTLTLSLDDYLYVNVIYEAA